MNLHLDRDAFAELVSATSIELHIPANIVEKDYYVTLALRELSANIKGMVFKGGTSLTKCYQILERFSEDIDISYAASEGIPGESRKRQLKKAIIASMDILNFSIKNLEQTRSRRNYNCYRAVYPSIYPCKSGVKTELIIETYIALLPFPTTVRKTDNYIYRFLYQSDQLCLAEKFNLMPFETTTQAIERTLIDKVFAVCDYYLSGKVAGHSRHLYDIHKILNHISLSETFPSLVQEVRELRAPLSVCPSAAKDKNINQILEEIITLEIYKQDYLNITENLLFVPLSYETAISGLQRLLDGQYFK